MAHRERVPVTYSNDSFFTAPITSFLRNKSDEDNTPVGVHNLSPETDIPVVPKVREDQLRHPPPSPIGFSPRHSPKFSSSPVITDYSNSPPPSHMSNLFGSSNGFSRIPLSSTQEQPVHEVDNEDFEDDAKSNVHATPYNEEVFVLEGISYKPDLADDSSTHSSRSSSPTLDNGQYHDPFTNTHGEHPLGEHPSRTLFVRNINSNVEDEELTSMFEVHGPIRSIYTQCKHRGFVMISYYDIRHAKNAMRHLQGKQLRRRKLDIHYSIPKDNPSEKDQNQGTLVIFNLDPSITNEELKARFGSYGEIKEIRETPNKKHHKFIEFYDVREAEKAMKMLNKTEIKGKKIKIEPSRPGGSRKPMVQQFPVEFSEEEDELPLTFLHPNKITKSGSLDGQLFVPKEAPTPSNRIAKTASLTDTSLFSNSNPGFNYGFNSPLSSPTLSPKQPHRIGKQITKSFSTNSATPADPLSPMRSSIGLASPATPPSSWGSGASYSSFHMDSPSNSPRDFRSRKGSDASDNSNKFFLDLDRVKSGEDRRTTLMIKNIPNKYSQKMLLSTVDEKHRGLFDFFYLPIDFKNKCNVGYAFINFIDPQCIPNFHEEFHNKKWEKFNSEKVCEITYARIQGKQNLITHFQNSSLMNEDKKCRPIIFHSDGPNMGEQEPFPVALVPKRKSSGSRDDLARRHK